MAATAPGSRPIPIAADTGVQLVTRKGGPATTAIGAQQGTPGAKNGYQVGFSVASLGDPADKSGKDDNFRGETVFGDQLYVSKGSGGNGVNTVYQVSPGSDPVAPGDASITILPGFPTGLAADISATAASTEFYPFGLWFADKTTLYVADEGVQSPWAPIRTPACRNGSSTAPGGSWRTRCRTACGWIRATTCPAIRPRWHRPPRDCATWPAAWTATRVTVFATTATFSANTDPGADPNQVVRIVDQLDATTLPGR